MKTPQPVAPVLPAARERLACRPIGLESARITGGVWADWQRDNREMTTPHCLRWLEFDGTVDNLRRLDPSAPGLSERRGLWFTDSDVYKALEGVAWDLGREPSEDLDALVTDVAGILSRAQEPDGYLNSFVQAGLDVRWDNLVKSHELYCVGHLIQAGIAHKRATGRTELFDVAVKAADLAVRSFGDGRRGDADGHEEIEMALVELYRETRDRAYLDLAQQFVDVRGHGVLKPDDHFDSAYYQDATAAREETTVVGHAVRAIYLLAGMVDLYVETGDRALLRSAVRQWESMTNSKTYLTGAVGSRFIGEAFGDSYELPPDLVYGETCATIGNIMLSWRLLLVTGQSRYADTIERGLYNLFAASTSIQRTGFFYSNPAQRRTALPASPTDTRPQRVEAPGTRPPWFECACCPPNILRTVASLSAYVASHSHEGVQIHQYMPSALTLPLVDGIVKLNIETGYPVNGVVIVTVAQTPDTMWTLALRKPDWARSAVVTVNDQVVDGSPNERGYVEVRHAWSAGDVLVLTLPVEPRLTILHPAADALRGTVAIERGPVVYALESPDQAEGVDLNRVEILTDRALVEDLPEDFLGQSTVIVRATGLVRDDAAWSQTGWMALGAEPVVTGREVELVAIPYALWANRGPSVMRVFVPAHREVTGPGAIPLGGVGTTV